MEHARREAALDEMQRRSFNQGAWRGLLCGLVSGSAFVGTSWAFADGDPPWVVGLSLCSFVVGLVVFWRSAPPRRS